MRPRGLIPLSLLSNGGHRGQVGTDLLMPLLIRVLCCATQVLDNCSHHCQQGQTRRNSLQTET